MADRRVYLAALQATDRKPFKPAELAKRVGRKPNIIRAWLSRDKKAGLVETTPSGKYALVSKEKISAEILKIERNSATGGSSEGSRRGPKNPQLCRLHNVQFYAKLVGHNVKTIAPLLATWDEKPPGPGSRRWELYPVVLPDMGANCKMQLSAGKDKAALQIWLDPILTNSFKLFDQLEAVHDAAQVALRLIAFEYRFNVALLEVKRSAHFAIKIPVRESWKITRTGFKMVDGKLWVNADWWIDQSYSHELETASEKAFGDLMEGLQAVPNIEEKVAEILEILKPLATKKEQYGGGPHSDLGDMYG